MNDALKKAILQASLMNLGHLLPPDMSVTFRRGEDGHALMETTYPDGEVQLARFTRYGPLFDVREACEAVRSIADAPERMVA